MPVFSAFHSNVTVSLPGGRTQPVARGTMTWPPPLQRVSSDFAVLQSVLSAAEVATLLGALTDGSIAFDGDPDSVDGMVSHEIFLSSNGRHESDEDSKAEGEGSKAEGGGVPSKMRHPDAGQQAARLAMRRRLVQVTAPIMEGRLTPYVRQAFPKQCGDAAPQHRRCVPCASLVRRYRPNERRSHATHYDNEAIVTVVVSLADHGAEYTGGLYLAAGSDSTRQGLGLNRGDAVVHQSDLLHGVNVESGERWSWILWYRDSPTCEDKSHEWFEECAEEGNAICEGLHAAKMKAPPGMSEAAFHAARLSWHAKAAEHGLPASIVKMARAYLKQLPSSLPRDHAAAARWLRYGIAQWADPECFFGLGQMLLSNQTAPQAADLLVPPRTAASDTVAPGGGGMPADAAPHPDASSMAPTEVAVRLFEQAAVRGHAFASYNLGVAHLSGHGVRQRDAPLAAEWFGHSGLPEGLHARSLHHVARGEHRQAEEWRQRAATLGYGAPWREKARDHTGSGGAGGVSLHSDWPDHGAWCAERVGPSSPGLAPPS